MPLEFTNRFAYVDCLRAMAALMVIIMHTSEQAIRYLKYAVYDAWIFSPILAIDLGRAGVVVFFAISGFVIPSSLHKGDHPATFPIRRFFRLYPAYWLSIVVGLYATWWLLGREPTNLQVAANITMLQWFFGSVDVLGVYWTLAVELVFYVICYALFLTGLINCGAMLGFASLFCVVAWYLCLTAGAGPFYVLKAIIPTFITDVWKEWFAYFSIMFFGATCRMVSNGSATRTTTALAWIVGFCWLAVFPLTGLYLYWHSNAQQFVLAKFGAYALAMYGFIIFGLWIRLRGGVLAYLGKISYSLYLLHSCVLYISLRAYQRWTPDLPVSTGMSVIIVAGVTVLVSAVTYRWVEAPAIAFSKKVTHGLARGAATRGTIADAA